MASRHGAGRSSFAVLRRAGKEMLDHNMTVFAQALAYSAFFAIPSVLLLAVGLFTLLAGPATITHVIDHLGGVIPGQAKALLLSSIQRLGTQQKASLVMVIVGAALALWATTSAMTSYMTALNVAYGRKDRRNFVAKRVTALLMVGCVGFAFLLVAVFLIFGPVIETHLGATLGIEGFLGYVWWAAQWPIVICGLAGRLRRAALSRPGRRPPALAFRLSRVCDRGVHLACRLRRVRLLHGKVQPLQQGVGLALGSDRDAHLALAVGACASLRRGGERRG